MNDRELKAAAVGIITYCSICQTGNAPELDDENQIIEAAAFLDNVFLEKALEICSAADLDDVELMELEDE